MAALKEQTNGEVLRDGARQPQGRQALRPALARRGREALRRQDMTKEPRHRHHRLRQHLRRLLPPRAALQGPRGARLHRHQHGRRRGARQGVRRAGRDDRRPPRQPRRRRRHQPHHPRRALRASPCAALEAGKHVYSEKPFVLTIEEGKRLKEIADAKGLRVGSAPDTFLGGAHQLARKLDRRRHASAPSPPAPPT